MMAANASARRHIGSALQPAACKPAGFFAPLKNWLPQWLRGTPNPPGSADGYRDSDAAVHPNVLIAAARSIGGKLSWPGTGCAGQAGWAMQGQPLPPDATAQFEAAYKSANAGQNPLPPEAKQYRYLMVGGLFTSHYPGYFKQNEDALRSAGLQVQAAPIDTGASVEANAKVIRDTVLAGAPAQFVLVGQSKGGVDITSALALYPEIKPYVRAVVSMQAPYGGTPIASDLGEATSLQPLIADAIQTLFKGSPAALSDLSYPARRAFVQQHPYPQDVPTLSLATARADAKSILFDTSEYMLRRYGLPSDGLVPMVDAIIPGSTVVKLTNMDHADGVLHGLAGFQNYQPGPLTTALVATALQIAR
jgi:triacylglycerol lipase